MQLAQQLKPAAPPMRSMEMVPLNAAFAPPPHPKRNVAEQIHSLYHEQPDRLRWFLEAHAKRKGGGGCKDIP